MRLKLSLVMAVYCVLVGSVMAEESTDAVVPLPPAATGEVDYSSQIKPILDKCAQCHTDSLRMGGLRLDSRENLLRGGASGPAAVSGDSENSLLIAMVAGRIPEKVMPLQGPRLTDEEIGLLRAWIDGGLTWDGEADDGRTHTVAWKLNRPALPQATADAGVSNPIDRMLEPYFAEHGVTPRGAVEDAVFARRVYLDLLGLLPTPEELAAFTSQTAPDRREKLVHRLLNDKKRYAEHWLSFWNDLLRNEYKGTGFIDGGRKQISHWLFDSLVENKPYNQFVADLIAPVSGSEGFAKGIIWRGVVNSSQTPEMQAAQNISQVFLGINLKCASCHDSFINDWKLADSYALASVYADKPLELHRCNVPTGQTASVKFLTDEFGEIDAEAPKPERQKQLAAVVTHEENGRFTRTIINRVWARLMGRGFVEPVDEMDNPPWNPELLDWLAADLVDRGYDLKKTLALIVTSRAYQLAAVDSDARNQEDYVFTGPVLKRMSAEQYVDALSSLTGVWQLMPTHFYQPDGRGQGGQAPPDTSDHDFVRFASENISSGSVEIDIDITGARTLHLVTTDGRQAVDIRPSGDDIRAVWGEPELSGPAGTLPLTDLKWRNTASGNAKPPRIVGESDGLLHEKTPRFDFAVHGHARSSIAYDLPEGYTRLRAEVALGRPESMEDAPAGSIRFFVLTDTRDLRAVLAHADPLTQALGRPNREQVTTSRESVATTLQALELTNGETLDKTLKQGASHWLEKEFAGSREMVDAIYVHGLGRLPTPPERETAESLIGTPPAKEGVEDLLWAVAMLPEFQLIY